MADWYLSEIRCFSFNFQPKNWAFCNGQILNIATNQALFSLLGTNFGGNGQTTFALPDLRGRTPVGWGNYAGGGNYTIGQKAGEENHTLLLSELPQHFHFVNASANSPTDSVPSPTNLWAKGASQNSYDPNQDSFMSSAAIGMTGGNQPHENRSPYLVLNFCIALVGVYPSRN